MKKHDIKMIVLDIDGTIMNNKFQISEKVKNTLNICQQEEIKIVLASGRMHHAVTPISFELGINSPIISYQGSIVREYTPIDNTIYQQSIDFSLAIEVIEELRNIEGQLNFFTEDLLYIEKTSELLTEYTEKRNIKYTKINSFNDLQGINPIKLLFINKNSEKLTEIKDKLRAKFSNELNIFKSTSIFCEIVNKNATKGNAIKFLANYWNVNLSEILAIGDHENDIEMLKTVGVSVGMGNAIPEVKEITTYITDTVDNDGAAKALEKIVLGL